MEAAAPSPAWHPDRRWVDPFILLLSLLALLATSVALRVRGQGASRPLDQVSLQGRLLEVGLAGPALVGRAPGAADWARARARLTEPWDRALVAVLAAEQELRAPVPGPRALPDPLPPGVGGDRFRRAFLAAYGEGPLPAQAEREDLRRRLGRGYAADLLEARLQDHEGGGEALRQRARAALGTRLAGLGFLGLLALALAAGGVVLAAYLMATRHRPQAPLPAWDLSGRAAAVVMLGWFLGFFMAGQVAVLLLSPWPGARSLVPPLTYLLHAGLGVFLLCQAEGLGLAALWRRLAPGRPGRDLAWGGAFLGLAVLLVLAVALATSALAGPEQSPQRDLQELVRGLSGWLPNLAMFLTVAAVAPFFEEVLFRGFLFPVLARGGRTGLALLLSALLFGAIHLQPLGLPVLGTLGLVMGLAMRHTGSLRAPILVHACWNGSLFLLMRAFA